MLVGLSDAAVSQKCVGRGFTAAEGLEVVECIAAAAAAQYFIDPAFAGRRVHEAFFFKGGKGVASAFGFILALSPVVAGCAFLTWIACAVVTRYSSLSAILAAAALPLYAYFYTSPVYAVFYTAIALLVLVRHHANIARLIKGQESKISFKKK